MASKARSCALSVATVALIGLLLAGCASPPPLQTAAAPAAHGWSGAGYYRIGLPYKINGVWYYPAVDYDYDRTGVASWYGEQFDGRLTANGEIFDLNRLTAAHTTLPMPSVVQVTNLENGRSLQLRVNDRGPFVDGRLIDVSRRAAQLLAFEGQGTTLVRVQVLKEESIAAAEEAIRNSGQIFVADAGAAAAMTTMLTAPVPARTAPAASVASLSAAPPPWFGPAQQKPPAPPIAPVVAATAPTPRPLAVAMVTAPSAPPASATPTPPAREPAMQTAALSPPPTSHARPARSPFSRFALISPAEAAELPPPRRPPPLAHPPAPEKPNSPSRVATAPSGPAARIYVQAGAFALPDNARRVQSRVAHFGSAEVTAASVHGVELYRVRLGPLLSAAQAQELRARLVESGYREARIVGD
jgi:rare lipoprotein A